MIWFEYTLTELVHGHLHLEHMSCDHEVCSSHIRNIWCGPRIWGLPLISVHLQSQASAKGFGPWVENGKEIVENKVRICYGHLSFIVILHLCTCYHISFILSCSCLYEKYITRLLAYMASQPFFELDFWTWFRGRMPGQVQASPSASSAVPGPITVPGTLGQHTHLPKQLPKARRGGFPWRTAPLPHL